MKSKGIIGIVLGIAPLVAPKAWVQVNPDRWEALTEHLAEIKSFAQSLGGEERNVFSGAVQNLFQLAEHWDRVGPQVRETPPEPVALADLFSSMTAGAAASANVRRSLEDDSAIDSIPVSNPGTDFFLSLVSGFTQSETSTAWCGNNVVVGFNDSGSFYESLFFTSGGLSFNGVGRSTNRGASFTDLFFLNPGADFRNFLLGDPVVGCTDPLTFYYASLFQRFATVSTPSISAISVSKSTNGGLTFDEPVVAASKPLSTHVLDKEWMGIDPTNPTRIFVTYTDFDFANSPPCVGGPGGGRSRVAIELVRSLDGGATWDAPIVIDEVCRSSSISFPSVQGSQVVVGPNGEVYVAWERYDDFSTSGFLDFITRQILIRKSVDNGGWFGPAVKVADVFPVGDAFALRGGFRTFLDFQGLAVDRSSATTRGNVYVAWHDGGTVQRFDLGSDTGVYGFADILFSRSTDGGMNWSAPIQVNDNLELGFGTDQYQPGLAVDKTGKLGACFYDRRRDPQNFLIEYFCAESTDAGSSWSANRRASGRRFLPLHAVDNLINTLYMGDYDALTSDFTHSNGGFIGAHQEHSPLGNPDVKATRLR